MSTLKIWETVQSTRLPIVRIDERTNYQTVTFTGTAGVSAAFDTDTSVVLLSPDVACAVRVSTAGTLAVITDYPIPANPSPPYPLEVAPGQKISVIAT
jgi:bisphosphoglycerate-independent phosphoglycerate mutase (AlkP superfamily)